MKVICSACGSTEMEHLEEIELTDRHGDAWSFSAIKCKVCNEVTVVTTTSEESVANII